MESQFHKILLLEGIDECCEGDPGGLFASSLATSTTPRARPESWASGRARTVLPTGLAQRVSPPLVALSPRTVRLTHHLLAPGARHTALGKRGSPITMTRSCSDDAPCVETRPTPEQIIDLAARPQHESGDPHPRLDAPPESLGGTMRFHRRGIYAHAALHSLGSISRARTPLRALSTQKAAELREVDIGN